MRISISDPLPTGTTFVSGAGCAPDNGAVRCAIGPLPANGQKVFDLQLKLDAPYPGARPLVNTASIVDAAGDPQIGNNSASASTPVAAETPVGIPTLSQWALLMLAALLGLAAARSQQRQRHRR